jgi:hypothetical protein
MLDRLFPAVESTAFKREQLDKQIDMGASALPGVPLITVWDASSYGLEARGQGRAALPAEGMRAGSRKRRAS